MKITNRTNKNNNEIDDGHSFDEMDLEIGESKLPLHRRRPAGALLNSSDSTEIISKTSTTRSHYCQDSKKQQGQHHQSRRIGRFRSMEETDRDQVKALHEAWFPVKYEDTFYDEIAKGKVGEKTLFTCLATAPAAVEQKRDSNDNDDEVAAENGHGNIHRENINAHGAKDDHDDNNHDESASTDHNHQNPCCDNNRRDQNANDDVVVGCVIGAFIDCSRASDIVIRDELIGSTVQHPQAFYVMTLGVEKDWRSERLGTALLQECYDHVEENTGCGIIYLHVETSNIPAVCFYEKHGFFRVKEIPGYYLIDDKPASCYLYAKNVHGTSIRMAYTKCNGKCIHLFGLFSS